MRFSEYDYQEPEETGKCPAMDSIWDTHWDGRKVLKEDLSDEPLWPTIRHHLRVPGRLLEAGCGTGQLVQFLGKLGHDAVGVDYAASGLEVGRAANPNLNLIQADLRKLPFPDESFDYIVSFGAVEHAVEGPEAALRELLRVPTADGWLLCSVPCVNIYLRAALPWMVVKDWLRRRAVVRRMMGHREQFVFYQYLWTPAAYRRILRRVGFRLVELRRYGEGPSNPRLGCACTAS